MTESGADETRVVALEAEVARLRAALDETPAAARTGGDDAAVLSHLADRLYWEGAPRSLRAVLPLARVLRRVSASTWGVQGGLPVPVAAAAPAGPRQNRLKRLALRVYTFSRPVVLPLARRLHRVLSRLLEREGLISQRESAETGGIDPTAELLRSAEAALLTLALQRRQNG